MHEQKKMSGAIVWMGVLFFLTIAAFVLGIMAVTTKQASLGNNSILDSMLSAVAQASIAKTANMTVSGTSTTFNGTTTLNGTTIVTGNVVLPVANGAWYGTTAPVPSGVSFAYVVPAVVTDGALSQFTESAGVLTYTGTHAHRFRFTSGFTASNGSTTAINVTWTINGALPVSVPTNQTVLEATIVAAVGTPCSFTDNIFLNPNDNVRLIALSSAGCTLLSLATVIESMSN
jgi:hypothetical protein